MTYIQGNYHFELRNLPYLSPWMHWTPCTPLNMKSLAMSSALRTNQQWSFTCRSEALNEAKWNLGKVKIKPMLPVLQDQGRGEGSREVCRGIAMCFARVFALFACLLAFPSLPHFWRSINSTHWYFLFSVVLTGAWRWAVARLQWWSSYCWGDCCPPLLLHFVPLQHLPSNSSIGLEFQCD